ncbi:Rab family GTPase [Entamoeba marina]
MVDQHTNLTPLKVILLGNTNVGKTSIISRLINNAFFEETKATISASFNKVVIDDYINTYHLDIWDTAGQERYRSFVSTYFRGSNGAVVVYDVTNRKSFDGVEEWCNMVRNQIETISICIIANKIDCENRDISKEEGECLSEKLNTLYYEVSAKTELDVKNAFIGLSSIMKPSEKPRTTDFNVLLEDEEKYGCCD